MDARRKKKASNQRSIISNTVCIVSLLGAVGLLIFALERNMDRVGNVQSSAKNFKKIITSSLLHAQTGLAFPDPEQHELKEIAHAIADKFSAPDVPGNDAVIVNSHPDPPQQSKFAYVTLISGIDSKYRYRGFLYNALIMKRALKQFGSTADFIALIGYSEKDTDPFQSDIDLLRSHGIITYTLPRLLDEKFKLNFAEMALLKITPYSFTQYDRIQFFDGDVMPTRSDAI